MKKALLLVMGCAVALGAQALTYNVTVPDGTNACYIAGAMTDWSHVEMTKVDDTRYTITIDEATESQAYKYCSGPDWKYVEKDATGGEIDDRTYSEADVVASWAAVYDPNPSTTDGLTYNVTVPEGTKACYIAGDMTTWTFVEMTKVDDTHYTVTIDNATTSDGYKYCSGNDWAYVEKTADGGDVVNRTYSEADVVAAWAAVYDPEPSTGGLTYNVTVPEGTNECYIAGDMTGWLHQPMDRVDDTHYSITLPDATVAHGYKYCSGPGWAYEELNSDGSSVSNRVYNENDVVARWAAVYDPGVVAGSITFNVTVPAGTENCYLVGSFQDWDLENPVVMTNNGDGTFSATVDNVVDVQYKYYNGYAWESYEGNRLVSVTTATEVNDVVTGWDVSDAVKAVKNDNLKVWGTRGQVVVEACEAAPLYIHNLRGQLVRAIRLVPGTSNIALPQGIYIINSNKVFVF